MHQLELVDPNLIMRYRQARTDWLLDPLGDGDPERSLKNLMKLSIVATEYIKALETALGMEISSI
jgi:hypothetical protein